MLRALGHDRWARASARAVIGSKIERYEREGDVVIQSVFALKENDDDGHGDPQAIFWDNEGVVALRRAVPETMLTHAVSRPITDVIDHPLLRGLTTSSIHNGDDGSLVIDVEDALWTIERIEAET